MSKKVLIVDDEPHVIHVVKQFLERKGYSVSTACNGQRALEAYEESKPDVVITDVQMPIMGGQALCEQLLQNYQQETAKIYVMTSRTDKDLRVWAENYPSIDFLEKPLSLRRLSAKIDDFFGSGEDS
ncbi:MAG: response regulator [Cycloclasticus sp.]